MRLSIHGLSMTFWAKLALLVKISSLLLCGTAEATCQPYIPVDFRVIDSFGISLKSYRLILTGKGGEQITITPESSKGVRVQVGRYELKGFASLHILLDESLVIESTDRVKRVMFVPLGADQVTGDGEDLFPPLSVTFSREVRLIANKRVRLISIVSACSFDEDMGSDLKVTFPSVPFGAYLLLVLGEDQLISVREVHLTPDGDHDIHVEVQPKFPR